MNIALKEASETEYWLELLHETEYIGENSYESIINDNRETHKLIAEALLKYETLDAAQIKSIYETGKVPAELEEDTEEAHALSYDEVKEKMDDSEE